MGLRVIKLNGRKNVSKEFYKSLVTNIRLCQITGCAPFKYSRKGIENSVLGYCYLLILLCGYLALMAYFFLTNFNRDTISYHGPIYASSFLSVMTIWIEGSFRVNGWSVLLKKLIVIDQELLKFNIWVDYGKCLVKSRWKLIGQLVQIFIPIIMLYYFTIGKMYLLDLVLFYFIPQSINIILSYALAEIVCLIRERLHILNDLLKTLTLGNTEEISTVDSKGKKKPLEILCHVCTWHHNINKLIRMINDTFGFRMVALFGYTFVVEVINIYLICRQFNDVIIWQMLLYSLISTLCFAYCIYMVCNACEYTIKEAGKSGFLIHQIETNDCNMIDEIEMFSLQIANEDIEFSAAGFFSVNSSLMFSIIGGVTTYIIILIQLSSGTKISLNNTTTEMIDDISTTYRTTIV